MLSLNLTVNQALLAGSKPGDLVLLPAFITLEPLTPEGRAKYQAVLQRHSENLRSAPAPRKPWWRFW